MIERERSTNHRGVVTASILRAALCAVGLLACPLAGALAQPEPAPDGRIVLPANVVPDHYQLEITPDPKALTFTGRVRIDLTVRAPTDTITLNAADLVIDGARLDGRGAAPRIAYDAAAQTASFAFGHAIAPGPHVLTLAYHGRIYQQASGFFALDYVTPQGPKRALFTQFENSDARRFIPSWDEPGRKATFTADGGRAGRRDGGVQHAGRVHRRPCLAAASAWRSSRRRRCPPTCCSSAVGDFERIHRMVDGVDLGVVVKRGDTAAAQYALRRRVPRSCPSTTTISASASRCPSST